jgi:hypothetical protein
MSLSAVTDRTDVVDTEERYLAAAMGAVLSVAIERVSTDSGVSFGGTTSRADALRSQMKSALWVWATSVVIH